MKNPGKSKNRIVFDQVLLGLFVTFDLVAGVLAINYFQSLNKTTQETYLTRSPASEETDLQDLEKIIDQGSNWETFERARMEKVEYYLQSNERPSDSKALYFFPEVLPNYSFENQFALEELKPTLEALKKAVHQPESEESKVAFQKLRSRVENYELGVSSNPADLSIEASKFLSFYEKLSRIKHR